MKTFLTVDKLNTHTKQTYIFIYRIKKNRPELLGGYWMTPEQVAEWLPLAPVVQEWLIEGKHIGKNEDSEIYGA